MDDSFTDMMTEIEEDAWNAFKEVVKKFLGDIKDPLYKETVWNMLDKFKLLSCNMSLKLHFLASHRDYFPPNLGAVSEEQGERFHQDWCRTMLSGTLGCKYDGQLLLVDCTWWPFKTALKNFKNTQILRETKKGDRGILTYISKECNVSKLSTHVPFTLLAKLFCLCVISLFSPCVIFYLRSEIYGWNWQNY